MTSKIKKTLLLCLTSSIVLSSCQHTNLTVCVNDFESSNPTDWKANCDNPKQGKFTLPAPDTDGFVSMPPDDARQYIQACEAAKKALEDCERRCK